MALKSVHHVTKTDNKSVANKIFLRRKATEHLDEIRVLDLFAGKNVLWTCIDKIRHYGVELIPDKGANLTADAKRVIRSLDLSQFNVIDIGDVYCNSTDQCQTTREALIMLNQYHAPVAVLSKGGGKMLRDVDVFGDFGKRITVGTTLTFLDREKSRQWEPCSSSPAERLAVLAGLHSAGIKTFASFEPVIEPSENLKLIEKTLLDDSVNHYKIGKLNNYKGLDKGVDCQGFLREALAMLRPANKQLYIKECLRELAPGIELYEDEIDPQRYIVRASSAKVAI